MTAILRNVVIPKPSVTGDGYDVILGWGEDLEDVEALFSRGGDYGSKVCEDLSAFQGSERTEPFILTFANRDGNAKSLRD